jgi:NAD(P)-dependent dehydrogenase (short-subunit alcohol dehydrogenase family)
MQAVLITGASSGIGEACAIHLDRLRFKVFAGVRKEADAEALRRKSSGNLTPVILDVTDENSISAAVKQLESELGEGGLYGLVNNAGIVVSGPLEFLPIAELRTQLDINVIGQIAVTQAFLPLIRKSTGRIINIGSVSGLTSSPLIGPYSASKYALEALTDTLRMELLPWGIEVVIIEPSAIATPIWARSLSAADALEKSLSPQAHQYYGKYMTGMRRFARSSAKNGAPVMDVARVVEQALVSPKPKTRYKVGKGIRFGLLFQRLPDRLRDRLTMRQLEKVGSYTKK